MCDLTKEEMDLIDHAVGVADVWGLGRISTAKAAIEGACINWKPEHERYIFDEYVDIEEPVYE